MPPRTGAFVGSLWLPALFGQRRAQPERQGWREREERGSYREGEEEGEVGGGDVYFQASCSALLPVSSPGDPVSVTASL